MSDGLLHFTNMIWLETIGIDMFKQSNQMNKQSKLYMHDGVNHELLGCHSIIL